MDTGVQIIKEKYEEEEKLKKQGRKGKRKKGRKMTSKMLDKENKQSNGIGLFCVQTQ